jgi:hypothetical protein
MYARHNIGHILILLRIRITSDMAVIILDDGNYTGYVLGYSLYLSEFFQEATLYASEYRFLRPVRIGGISVLLVCYSLPYPKCF